LSESSKREDTHFYLDNVPPEELQLTLRVLPLEGGLSPDEVAGALESEYGFRMQKDRTYSPRRAHDLGLARQARLAGKLVYLLTPRGAKVQAIVGVDAGFGMDLLHYLHYSSFSGAPGDRKYLWSYRRCCELVWAASAAPPSADMAAQIQAQMRETFPHLDWTAKVGARFDATAAGRLKAWLRALEPSPLPAETGQLVPREVARYELALLGLDDLYRARGYRYGDPVLLDDAVVDETAAVFFLKRDCCRDLLHLAARLSSAVKMADTLAGPSVNLVRAYTVDDL